MVEGLVLGAGRLAAENLRASPQLPARAGGGGGRGGGSPAWARAAARVGPAQRPPRLPQRPRAPRARVRRPRAMLGQGASAAEPRAQDGAERLGCGSAGLRRVTPGWGRRGGGRRRGPGWEGEGPTAAPSPARDAVLGFLPGSTSRLQPEGTPPATPEPARLLTRTPPLSSLLAPRTRPAGAPAAGPPRLPPPPPPGFKLKFPDWGRQRTQRANPAPFWRKPRPTSPRPARPGRGNPRGQTTPPRAGHAHGAGWRGRGGPSRGIRAAPRPSAPPRGPGSASERPWR